MCSGISVTKAYHIPSGYENRILLQDSDSAIIYGMKHDSVEKFIDYLKSLHHVHGKDVPTIPLYMDQLTSFMESSLSSLKRYPEDKVLTKTMINNYTKNKLLPPPIKKRYGRNHLLLLFFIYYYKNVLSLTDLQELLTPLNEHYFSEDRSSLLRDIYDEVFSSAGDAMEKVIADVKILEAHADNRFSGEHPGFQHLSDAGREELQNFALLSELAFDVYLKKKMMESLIDDMRTRRLAREQKEGAEKNRKKTDRQREIP